MKFFLIRKDVKNDYAIMKVQDEDIDSFQKEYQDKILLEARNVQILMIQFGKLIKLEETKPIQSNAS